VNDPYEYLYVVLDSSGSCWVVRDGGTERVAGLPSLLAEGWRPLRETAFHEEAYMLIVLERDSRGPHGFGFPTP
jgi:hypothetical protein